MSDAARAREAEEMRWLWQRPEAALASVDGAVVALHLTALRTEWLGPMADALRSAAEHAERPVPLLAVYRLDRRYPIRPSFDGNLGELRATFSSIASSIGACALALEFGGLMAAIMKATVPRVASRGRGVPEVKVFDGVVDGARWLAGEGRDRSPDVAALLATVAAMKRSLGCDGQRRAPR